MATKKLTPKQNKFCLELLKDFNASQSALRAGYSKKNYGHIGWELLQKTTIQQRLQELTAKQEDKNEITVSEIIQDLKILKDRCMQEIQVFNKKGEPTGEYQFDSAGANRSLELLGKHLAMFTDKFQVKSDDLHITVTIENDGDGGASGKPEHIGSNAPDQS